jgi:hypothetical protein
MGKREKSEKGRTKKPGQHFCQMLNFCKKKIFHIFSVLLKSTIVGIDNRLIDDNPIPV